jgi:hypothetical protein
MNLVKKCRELLRPNTAKPKISVVLISYNMARELPRTLFTLRAPYQKEIANEDIEIIVVDNGSTLSVDIPSAYSNVKLIRCSSPSVSPAKAVNEGVALASADLIGVMIDGARMVSPKLFSFALRAYSAFDEPVIATPGYHLGLESQKISTLKGYNQQVEDELLDSIPWQSNGYELLNISCFAGSSAHGWFNPMAESNGLFLSARTWENLNGIDESFQTLGGGLANLDLYIRACELEVTTLVCLFSEGTFHQVHGGISTNQHRADASWAVFHEEYQSIRGKKFIRPSKQAVYMGSMSKEHKKFQVLSAEAAYV